MLTSPIIIDDNPRSYKARRFIGPIAGGRNPTSKAIRIYSARSAQRKGGYPVTAGYARKSGFYGRYGQAALSAGLIPEKKFFDTALSFSFDATGEVPATGQLVLIPQDKTQSGRDGRQCTILSVQIKGRIIYAPGAGGTAATNIFLMLVQDTQANGAAAAVTDVLTGTNLATAFNNLANSGRFVTLKKWKWTMSPAAGVSTAYNNTTRHMDYYKKCMIPMEYSSDTGAITEIKSNNLFLLAGTDAINDDDTTFVGNCRVRFRG